MRTNDELPIVFIMALLVPKYGGATFLKLILDASMNYAKASF